MTNPGVLTHIRYLLPSGEKPVYIASRDGRARRSIHTAFSNPLAPPDAPARESMESRLLVFFS